MAGPVIGTWSFPRALQEGVKAWWDSAAKMTPQFAPLMYDETSSMKNYEEYAQSVGMGMAPVKPEGEPITYSTMQQGFVTRITNVAYGMGFIVTHEEKEDNLYVHLAKRRSMMLRRSFDETRNVRAADAYNYAFSAGSQYAGGDGVSLLNTAHPRFSGGTWANKLSVDSALSQAAVEDMLILMMQAQDDIGFFEPLHGRRLIVHPYNLFNAQRILETAKAVGTNNNDINPLRGTEWLSGGVVSNPYLASTGAWFIPTGAPDGLIYQKREPMRMWQDNDFGTMNARFAAYERYAFGWANPRGLYGSNAA